MYFPQPNLPEFARGLPASWRRVTCVDAHTGGEPLRVVLDGFPDLDAGSVPASRLEARARWEHLRTALMWEPRGHADMYGCLLVPPNDAGAHFGVLFMHNEGYSSMCGHGIIAVAKIVLQLGLLPIQTPQTELRIDTPAGRVTARVQIVDGQPTRVSFLNVPSYAAVLDGRVHVPGYGEVCYDLGFGGAYYAVARAQDMGLRCTPDQAPALIAAGRALKAAVAAHTPPVHPFDPALSFLYGAIFTEPSDDPTCHDRNVCVFADGEVDRSPTGTGVSARAALLHARGAFPRDRTLQIDSIIGSRFGVRVAAETGFGPHAAVIPEVTGEAFITGINTLLIDPDDPLREGFFLR